jgi:hypothetical protein
LKTKAKMIGNTVHFKHQYITNPNGSAAEELARALKSNTPAGNETVLEALTKVRELFMKIAAPARQALGWAQTE